MDNQIPIEEKGEIVLYQPDDNVRLEVRLQDETIWLTQQQMAELFSTTRNNITLHVGNIFKEGELDVNSVRKIPYELLQMVRNTKRSSII